MTIASNSYSQIPDGLWYCDLSHGAARVLGWLWVDPNRGDEIDLEGVYKTFGPGAQTWIAELAMAGFLDPHDTSGDRLRYELVESAWRELS